MRYFRSTLRRAQRVLAMGMLLATLLAPAARGQEAALSHPGLVSRLLPTVVGVTARSKALPPASELTASAQQPTGLFNVWVSAGSGYVVEPGGVIATNWHVVVNAFDITVTFSDGSQAKAKVTSASPLLDIALLQVDVGHPLTAVQWGDSSNVQIGDPVLAMGNPLGIGLSVTAGIVSAVNRNIQNTPFDDFIQTDAPINHGNSGGPLFDLEGKMVGMNTALISPTSGSVGLGFAMPANDVQFVIERLKRYGWLRPGFIGVKMQELTPDIALGLGRREPHGAIVAWVIDKSPGAGAGIRVGDIVLQIDDKVVSDVRAVRREVAASEPGRTIKLRLLRDGKEIEVSVTTTAWPRADWEERYGPVKAAEPKVVIPPDLGLAVEPLTPELRARLELPSNLRGVVVVGVVPKTDAARRGMSPGDVILQVGDVTVETAREMQQQIDRMREEKRTVGLFLILPKEAIDKHSKFPFPKWAALSVAAE